MNQGLIVILASFAALFIVACLVGWVIIATRNPQVFDQARGWAQIIGPLVTTGSVLVAILVAYQTFLTPFKPEITARPFAWRLGPVTEESHSFEIVMWLTIANEGAIAGKLTDLAIRITLPNGQFTLEPIAFVKSDEYYQVLLGKQLPDAPIEGPFTPIFLPGRSQHRLAVLFLPGTGGVADFNPLLVQPGQHNLSLYARFNSGSFELIKSEEIIFEPDHLKQWQAGITIGGQVTQRDKPTRELLNRVK